MMFILLILILVVLISLRNIPFNKARLPLNGIIDESGNGKTIFMNSNLTYSLKTAYQLNTNDDAKGLGYTGQHKIAVDKSGNIFITYRKKYNGNYEVFVTKLEKQNGGKYTVSGSDTPISIVGNSSTQRVSSIDISENNVISVVWYGLDSGSDNSGRQIKMSQSSDSGKTWSSWRNIAHVSGYNGETYWQEHPEVASYRNNIYVVWEGKDSKNTQQQIKFTESTNGGKDFSKWINIQATPNNTQSRPSIVIDSNGWIHVFMYSSQNSTGNIQQIWHTVSKDNGSTWSQWENISRSQTDARHVSAVYFGSSIIAAWRQQISNNGPTQIFYSILTNGTWSDPKIVRSSKNYQMFPDLGKDINGVVLTWMETPNPSGFPNDDPGQGYGYVSYLQKDGQTFGPAAKFSTANKVLYPHVSTSSQNEFYIVYQTNIGKEYGVLFNVLKVN